MAEAAQRAGREPGSVTLVAVTKTVPPELVQAAVEAGVGHIGENRVQEAREKRPQVEALLGGRYSPRWHLIGPLQRNKVNMALPLFDVFHSWDRLPLVEAFSRKAQEQNRRFRGLVQVNIGREATKHGVDPDEVIPFLRQVCSLPGLEVHGLMCIPPLSEDPEETRPYFRRMRDLLNIAQEAGVPLQGNHLSMGMSHDFEVAIEEGATLVRVGRTLFGPRPQEG